ncbi:MAG: CDP-glucose 4,6-dehydratase [Elusimicrobia bacterium]|nr:CDP-glucose 4,6-dehydratase [Elusimicrobiota bacterium]
MDDMALTTRDLAVFSGARVFITGDTGFKGSWLAYWLWSMGARVMGYALPVDSPRHLFARLGLARKIIHLNGDVRDSPALFAAVRRHKPEFVFHLAAQSLVAASLTDPQKTFDVNVGGTVNVLDAVRRQGTVRSLIVVTSDKCYRNNEWPWGYRENDTLGGRDPYSGSKAAAEMVFSSYDHSYFADRRSLGAATVRAGNVLGGGDWAKNRIVPDCVRALIAGRPIVVRHPGATRPWQHVLEPLSGYLTLALRLRRSPKAFGGSWNFGPSGNASQPVMDVVRRVVAGWGGKNPPVVRGKTVGHESTLLALNSDKARRLLNWQTRWGFERTVDETVRWYKTAALGGSVDSLTGAQINEYLETRVDS